MPEKGINCAGFDKLLFDWCLVSPYRDKISVYNLFWQLSYLHWFAEWSIFTLLHTKSFLIILFSWLVLIFFIPISIGKKGILTLVRMGVKEIVEIGIDMYIYSWSARKKKTFSKNVCPPVRAQKLCTLKLKNG